MSEETRKTWIEENPNATRLERVLKLTEHLRGTCQEPSEFQLEDVGLEDDFSIYEESSEICASFDDQIVRCQECDWWIDPGECDDKGRCDSCSTEDDDEDDDE